MNGQANGHVRDRGQKYGKIKVEEKNGVPSVNNEDNHNNQEGELLVEDRNRIIHVWQDGHCLVVGAYIVGDRIKTGTIKLNTT